jgi:hypothetical protein
MIHGTQMNADLQDLMKVKRESTGLRQAGLESLSGKVPQDFQE